MKNFLLFSLFVTLFGLHTTANCQNFSLEFDGEDDEVQFAPNQGLLGENFTIEGWLKCQPTGFPQDVIFGHFDQNVAGQVLGVQVQISGVLRFIYRPDDSVSGGFDLYTDKIVDNNQWHHFACVKEDNQILKIYLNGILESTICTTTSNITQPFYLEFGTNKFVQIQNYRRLLGNLDDVKTWTIAKSNREIFADFKKEHTGTEEGIYNNYKFDVQSDTIFDCSINKNHGIRVGGGGNNNKPQFSTDIPSLVNADCGFFFVGTDDDFLVKDQKIQIYPNPTDQEAIISTGNTEKSDAQIFNQAGQLIRMFTIEGGVSKISTANLPAGMYELRIISRDGISVAKFVKR